MYHGFKRKKLYNLKMCTTGILPTWYNDFLVNSTSNIPKYFRFICIFTATSAFILGIVIGLMIPIYLLPATVASLKKITTSPPTVTVPSVNITSTPAKSVPIPPMVVQYDTVSFVPALQRPVSIIKETEAVNSSLVKDGIYWSTEVEDLLPPGYDSESAQDWRTYVRKSRVVKVEEGCGRMQNRLITFDNGTLSCCRYRQNVDQIQGEIFSFYLGRYVLNLPNLTPATLSRVKPQTRQWASVKSQLSVAQWATEDRAVVLTKFIPNLGPAYIPTNLRPSERRLHPPDLTDSTQNLIELVQWSDLVIFDYLTANLDRVVNNLYNLQWNPSMMEAPAHNLAVDKTSGLLIFLDNESGLLHGYRLLEKYEHFHRAMLDALCIFRRSTVDIIRRLHEKNNIGELLRSAFKNSDPEFNDILPTLPEKSVKILNKRIARVQEQISRCENLYKKS